MYLPTCVMCVYIPVYLQYFFETVLFVCSRLSVISYKLTLNSISIDTDGGLFFKKAFVCLTAVLPFIYKSIIVMKVVGV